MSLTVSLSTASSAPSFSNRPLSAHLQSLALPGLFSWFGLVMGSWAGRIPALREGLQISHQMLSMVLLCGGLGAYASYFLDGATGGLIVVLQTLVFLTAFVFAPKHGRLASWRRNAAQRAAGSTT